MSGTGEAARLQERANQRVKTLMTEAEASLHDDLKTTSLPRITNALSSMYREAMKYAPMPGLDDQIRAFTMFYKLVVVVEKLPKHPDFAGFKTTQMYKQLRDRALQALDLAQRIKPRIIDGLVKEEARQQRATASRAATLPRPPRADTGKPAAAAGGLSAADFPVPPTTLPGAGPTVRTTPATLTPRPSQPDAASKSPDTLWTTSEDSGAATSSDSHSRGAISGQNTVSNTISTPQQQQITKATARPDPPPYATMPRPTRPSPSPPVSSFDTAPATAADPAGRVSEPSPPASEPGSPKAPRSLEELYARSLGLTSLSELPSAVTTYDAAMSQPSQRQQLLSNLSKPSGPPPAVPTAPPAYSADVMPSRPPPSAPSSVNDTSNWQYNSRNVGTLQRRIEKLRPLVLPVAAIEKFKAVAAANSARNKETCGILAGTITNDTLCITHVLIPKQNGTSDTCAVTDDGELELLTMQDDNELMTLGWIHTHPSQSAFLSSIDLHTSYPYQLMMPEALAIVCAIQHNQTGVFRLTPSGMQIIGSCNEQGFHPHPGSDQLFENSSHVLMRTSDPCELLDLR